MTYDFAPKLAQVLTEHCRPIQPGQFVLIQASTLAEELIPALVEAVLRRGGNPVLALGLPGLEEIYLREARGDQFDFVDPGALVRLEQCDVLFSISAPSNPRAMTNIPPEKLKRAQEGQRALRDVYMGRIHADTIGWNICAWPTQAAAQQAEMGYYEYREFVYRAAGLHHDDPVAHWQAFKARQAELQQWLSDKDQVEVRGPGVELTFRFDRRHWRSSFGERNFPDGEIYTAPVEDSVNGRVEFNLPTYYGGREVRGVVLTFRDGVCVEATAERGEEFLLSVMDTDEGAKRLGEFAIGTNWGVDRVTGNTLFDEKMGGTIHMALGNGYPQTGSVNESVVHWDMVHDMRDGGEVWVDGTLFYKAGEFQVR